MSKVSAIYVTTERNGIIESVWEYPNKKALVKMVAGAIRGASVLIENSIPSILNKFSNNNIHCPSGYFSHKELNQEQALNLLKNNAEIRDYTTSLSV